ncbi:TonB-dependent receptor [Thalassotalea sp. G2M2-11]|uniref:TonB-dependent receptor n=1 Tax=Thalassotalea sp. G2M2-11 TaxID=2787627 RepID=UPI0019D191C0|nr:TonB-dependent receptor [Thalassotalea sp. G2M2-11]
MIKKMRLVGLISVFCVVLPSAAKAKDSEAVSTDDALEKIQIRGIRGSIVKSMNTKRYSDSILDAITAEEIGKFPDKNVAESLQRITGVSIKRVQGEGERIGVRGTAPSQNRTYLNNQSIASADWWISSQPNRGFNYTLLPSEIVSSLEVHKSPQADHDEGSLGGSINIKTHSPLETKDQMFIGSAQLQYSDVSREYDPQLSMFYNWINDEKTLGALFSVTRHERSLRRDGLESWGWLARNYNRDQQGNLRQTLDTNADLIGIWSPGGGGSAIFQQQRILSSAMMLLQFQPSLDWDIELNSLFSELSADNSNQNFLWQPSNVYARGGFISDYQLIDNTLASAQYSKVASNNITGIPFNTAMEAIWRQSKIDTSLVHLSIKHDVNYWHTQYQIGVTRASGGTSKDFTSQWSANTDFSVDLTEQKNIITDYQVDPLDASQWQISEVRQDSLESTDQEFFAQADFEWQLDQPLLQSIKFGGKYKVHQRDFIRYRSKNGGYDQLAADLGWRLSDFSSLFPGHFLKGIGSDDTLKAYAYADVDLLNEAYQHLPFIQGEEKPSSFDISEKSYAGYVKANFSGDAYRGNFGLRLVHTQQDAQAFQKTVETDSIFEEYQWSATDKSYTDFLPSINLVVDLTHDVVLRLSASKVMSRAEYHHLMPSTNYNVTKAQGAGGNPNLDPFRATNFDLGVEWYLDEASLFSIAAFHKDVKSFIDIKRYRENYENIDMVINRPVNGSGGSIYGVELNLQKEVYYGVGVIANYTFVQGERKDTLTGQNIDIPGNSDHTVNVTAYYENDWISSRLSYNFRTEFATGQGEEITDDYGQVDVNFSFLLNDNISFVIEGINLFDEINYTYERNEFAPVGIYRNGRRFYTGIRVNY